MKDQDVGVTMELSEDFPVIPISKGSPAIRTLGGTIV
jgi:hypothetical protein